MLTDSEIDEVVDWQLQKIAGNCYGPLFELKSDFVVNEKGEAIWFWSAPARWPEDKLWSLDLEESELP